MKEPTPPVLAVLDWLRLWWPVLSSILFGMLAWGLFYLRTQFPSRAEFTELRKAGDQRGADAEAHSRRIEERVAKLETQVGDLPDRNEFHGMAERIGGVERQVSVVAESVRGVEKSVSKIDRTVELILQNQLDKEKRT